MVEEDVFFLLEELARAGINAGKLHGKMILTKKNKIVSLDLSGLKLVSIPPVVNTLVDLETLDLGNNRISTIDNLDNLVNLKTLDLTGNVIEEISGLESLISLSTLGLAGNVIEKITGLDNLRSLRVLNLSRNYIEETTGLEELEGLRHLDLSKNSIVIVKELFYPLDHFFLSGNPLTLLVLEKLVRLNSDDFIIWINAFSMDMAFYSDDGMTGDHGIGFGSGDFPNEG